MNQVKVLSYIYNAAFYKSNKYVIIKEIWAIVNLNSFEHTHKGALVPQKNILKYSVNRSFLEKYNFAFLQIKLKIEFRKFIGIDQARQ